MNWYLEVLKKYAVFDGRARRTEYLQDSQPGANQYGPNPKETA
jgi:uncharacterized membrane protein YhaH (DUF805 family)